MMDFIEEYWPLVLCGVALVVLVTLLVIGTANDKAACLESGGSWEVVGQSTYYVKSGAVMIPVDSDEYGCVGGGE